MFPSVTAKLGRMRKPQRFIVQPTNTEGTLIVQSDKSIGRFDFRSRKGVLNTKGCYFPHLSPLLGAEAFEFPTEFVAECLEVCSPLDGETEIRSGDTTVVIIKNTIQEI